MFWLYITIGAYLLFALANIGDKFVISKFKGHGMALLIEQTDKRLRVALRNAAVLYLRRPGFSALVAIVVLIIILLSLLLGLPLVLITWSLVAVICNKAVKHLLVPERERARAEEERLENEQA